MFIASPNNSKKMKMQVKKYSYQFKIINKYCTCAKHNYMCKLNGYTL